jgi:hypothetical protein
MSHTHLSARLLARCQYASGRSCDRFSWFSSVFKANTEAVPQLHASHADLTTWIDQNSAPLLSKPLKILIPKYTSTLNQKIKIPRSLSQTTVYKHPNAFIHTLALSEGQAGGAWEPHNIMKCLSLSPGLFLFIYFSSILPLALLLSVDLLIFSFSIRSMSY